MRRALAALLLTLASPAGASGPGLIKSLEDSLGQTHWKACLSRASAEGPALAPRAAYLAGLCALKLHDRAAARPLLEKARDGGFRPTVSWRKAPDELLGELDEFARLAPEDAKVDGLDPRALALAYDEPTRWTTQVAGVFTEFEQVGRTIFGGPPPFTRVYLFSDYARYERFYALGFGRGEAHGTGGVGQAIMSEKRASGRRDREPLAVVLHELTHAWCQGYGRDRHDSAVKLPPWVAEGLAVYVADSWAKMPAGGEALFAKQLAAHPQPVPFSQLRDFKAFHDKPDGGLDYGLSVRLVTRLLGEPERGLPLLPRVLDGYARGEGDEASWRFTGKSPAAEYAALSAELWKR